VTGIPRSPCSTRKTALKSSEVVPGLYFLGLSWQHTRGSALIGWVKDDAEFIAARIEAFRHERRAKQESDESATPALDAKEGA
jgi:hypothetical protein